MEALMAMAKPGDVPRSYILIAEKDGIELARAKSPSKDQAGFITFLVTHRLDIFDEKIKCRAEESYAAGVLKSSGVPATPRRLGRRASHELSQRHNSA
jgi:hypothetical protein